MSNFIHHKISNHIGIITLDRPQALNSLSLEMVRTLTMILQEWRSNEAVHAVLIHSDNPKAFCAGGDIRFFYDAGVAGLAGHSPQLEDFFTEEYALNHLIHFYPKPYISVLNGVVMGGGMGIAQAGIAGRLRIVTERTKMAMPEVNIGLFPDVGGSYFLSRTPGAIGQYLGLSGQIIQAADALYAGLADVFIPSTELPALFQLLKQESAADCRLLIRNFASRFVDQIQPDNCALASNRTAIDLHFQHQHVHQIMASLATENTGFTEKTHALMLQRSPLLMAVTLTQLERGRALSVAECLRMERTMVRHCFQHGDVIEGVRALVVDKDNAPKWSPATVAEVTPAMVERFFEEVWPTYAHPLRHLS
jgi:enoyl-CoA hydratase/carnithine racemase